MIHLFYCHLVNKDVIILASGMIGEKPYFPSLENPKMLRVVAFEDDFLGVGNFKLKTFSQIKQNFFTTVAEEEKIFENFLI